MTDEKQKTAEATSPEVISFKNGALKGTEHNFGKKGKIFVSDATMDEKGKLKPMMIGIRSGDSLEAIDVESLSDNVKKMALYEGLKVTLSRTSAGTTDPDEILEGIQARLAVFQNGEWTAARSVGLPQFAVTVTAVLVHTALVQKGITTIQPGAELDAMIEAAENGDRSEVEVKLRGVPEETFKSVQKDAAISLLMKQVKNYRDTKRAMERQVTLGKLF